MSSKKIIIATVILILSISSLFAKGRFIVDYGREPNQITVHYEKGVTEEEINSFVKRFAKYELRELWVIIGTMRTYWFSEEKKDVDDDTFLNLFREDAIVKNVDFPHFIFQDDFINFSPLLNSAPLTPWSFNHLNIPQAWADLENRPTNSFTPVIVTIDSGYFDFYGEMNNRFINHSSVMPTHYIHYEFDFLQQNDPSLYYGVQYWIGDRDNDYWAYDALPHLYNYLPHITHTHGARVLNLLKSDPTYNFGFTGITAPFSEIKHFPIQHANPNEERGFLSDAVTRAFQYALRKRREYNNNPNTGMPIVAINCSFGTYRELNNYLVDTWTAYADSLGAEGVLIVSSAGNEAIDLDYLFYEATPPLRRIPVGLDSEYVIGVAASTKRDRLAQRSNYGTKFVDLVAPGSEIEFFLSTEIMSPPLPPLNVSWPVNYRPAGHWGGTSVAAPHVSGTIALMYRAASQSQLNSHTPAEMALNMKKWLLWGTQYKLSLNRGGGSCKLLLNTRHAIWNVFHPPQEVFVNLTYSNDNITLDCLTIINSGALLTIANSTITPSPTTSTNEFFGYRNYGTLSFEDSIVNLGNAYIVSYGDLSTVNISNSVHNSTNSFDMTEGKIEILDSASLYVANTDMEITNGIFLIVGDCNVDFYHSNFSFLGSGRPFLGDGFNVYSSEITLVNSSLIVDGAYMSVNVAEIECIYIDSSQIIVDSESLFEIRNGSIADFSDVTLSLTNGSTLRVSGIGSLLVFSNESQLIVDGSSTVEIIDGGRIEFRNSTLDISGSGMLVINDAILRVHEGSIFTVADESVVTVSDNGYLIVSQSVVNVVSGSKIFFVESHFLVSDDSTINVVGSGSEIVYDMLTHINVTNSSINLIDGGAFDYPRPFDPSNFINLILSGAGVELVVDIDDEISLSNGLIEVSDGARLYIKNFELYVSDDFLITVTGEGSELILDANAVLSMDKSSLTISDGGSLHLTDSNLILLNESELNISGMGSEVVFGEDSAFDMYEGNISISGGGVADFSAIDFALSGSSRMSLSGEGSQAIFAGEGIITIEGESSFEVSDGAILSLLGMTVHISGESALWVDGSESGLIFSEASELHLSAGSIFRVSDGAETLFENNGILSSIESAVCLSDSASIYFHGTDFIMADATLSLSGGSGVFVHNGSNFITIGDCEIIGDTPASPPIDLDMSYKYNSVDSGDRIVFYDASATFSDGTVIRGHDGARWGGLYFDYVGMSSRATLAGTISDIESLIFINSKAVEIASADITNIGRMQVLGDSRITMNDSNYSQNETGIFVHGGYITISDTKIFKNSGDGLRAIYSPFSIRLHGVSIYENAGSGIDLYASSAILDDVAIYHNVRYGVNSISYVPSIISNGTHIYDNGLAQIVGLSRAFPHFESNKNGNNEKSIVSDDGTSTEAINQYLLMTLGPIHHPITLTHIKIDDTDIDRFFPDIDAFVFHKDITEPSKLLYRGIVDKLIAGEYADAYNLLESLTTVYVGSEVACSGVMLLPYIDRGLGGYMAYNYTPPIWLQPIAYFSYANALVLQGQFAEAISCFEMVINDPPDDITQLLAELDQAHAYYELYFGGTRGLPEVATHRPKSASELRAIQEDIYDRLYALGRDVEGEGEIVPLIERYSVTNYPNPFNPETTIVFEIPHSLSSAMQRESLTTHVRIDIYNAKGQRVKSLVNDDFPSGSHTVIWDGKDSSGREVASGVYLYMMQTRDWATTKKMLLLK